MRAAADLRLRLRGHRDRQVFCQSLPLSPIKMSSNEMTPILALKIAVEVWQRFADVKVSWRW